MINTHIHRHLKRITKFILSLITYIQIYKNKINQLKSSIEVGNKAIKA